MKKFTLAGAVLCVIAMFGVDARATTALAVSMEEQVASARAIVVGRCLKIESRYHDGAIVTYITLEVREVLKGRVSTGRLVVRQPGGLVGENGHWIYGSPRFDVGRDAAVFLASNGAGAYVVDGMFLGNFFLERGADGSDWLRRDSGGEGVQILKSRSGLTAQEMPATLPLAELRAVVARTASKAPELSNLDDFPQVPNEYDQPFEGESGVSPSFSLLNRCRWFEPDTGVVVQFFSNSENFVPGGGGAPPSIAAALTDALASWSTIPGSSLRLAYGGEDTNFCGWGPVDGKTMVSVDCRNEISGEACRSIIAIGGGHYTTRETVVVNGTTFYKIKESDVALQDGYCDYFQDPVALREVITHEVGHCIGLGHSEDRNANMAGFIHNDRRGATLTEDDKNGARFIYPAPGDGGGGGGGGDEDPEPPVIATPSLPDATVGFTYTSQFAVTNGKDPFAWTLTSGTLPTGIALSGSGLLAGAPTLPGTFQFSVRVTDSLGRVDGKFYTIRVKVPPPAIAAASYRGSKKTLTVSGQHFEAGAQFEINGILTAPPKPPVYNPSGAYTLKGSRKKLNLRKPSDGNTIVVIVQGERSQPFAF